MSTRSTVIINNSKIGRQGRCSRSVTSVNSPTFFKPHHSSLFAGTWATAVRRCRVSSRAMYLLSNHPTPPPPPITITQHPLRAYPRRYPYRTWCPHHHHHHQSAYRSNSRIHRSVTSSSPSTTSNSPSTSSSWTTHHLGWHHWHSFIRWSPACHSSCSRNITSWVVVVVVEQMDEQQQQQQQQLCVIDLWCWAPSLLAFPALRSISGVLVYQPRKEAFEMYTSYLNCPLCRGVCLKSLLKRVLLTCSVFPLL